MAGNPKGHPPGRKASPRARNNDARTGAHKQVPKQPATTRNTEGALRRREQSRVLYVALLLPPRCAWGPSCRCRLLCALFVLFPSVLCATYRRSSCVCIGFCAVGSRLWASSLSWSVPVGKSRYCLSCYTYPHRCASCNARYVHCVCCFARSLHIPYRGRGECVRITKTGKTRTLRFTATRKIHPFRQGAGPHTNHETEPL